MSSMKAFKDPNDEPPQNGIKLTKCEERQILWQKMLKTTHFDSESSVV